MDPKTDSAVSAESQWTNRNASGPMFADTITRNRDFDMDSQQDRSEQTDTVSAAAGPACFVTHYAPGRRTQENNWDDSVHNVGPKPTGRLPTMDGQPDTTSRGPLPATADNVLYGVSQGTAFATFLQILVAELTDHSPSVADGLPSQVADPPNGLIRGLEPSITDEEILHNLAEIDGLIKLLEFLRGSIPGRRAVYQEVILKLGIQRAHLHLRLFQSQERRQYENTVGDGGGHRSSSDLFPNAFDVLSMSNETRIGFDDSIPPTYVATTNPDPRGTLSSGYTHQVPPVSEDVMQWTLSHNDTPQSVGISSAWPTESRKRPRSVEDVLDLMQSNLLLQPGSDPEPLDSIPKPLDSIPEPLDSIPEPLGSNPESPGSDSESRMTKKVKMSACLRCRLGKRRCSGDGICSNCKEDKIQCVRPTWLDKNVFDYGEI